MTPEHKLKIAEGRRKAKEKRDAAKLSVVLDVNKDDKTENKTAVDKATPRRPKRTSLSEERNIMNVEGIPDGYHARWMVDDGNKILKMQERGYEFLLDYKGKRIVVGDKRVDPNRQTGSIVSKITGTDKTGKPQISYLMVTRQEWYDEDYNFKQSQIDETVEQIFRKQKSDGLVEMK